MIIPELHRQPVALDRNQHRDTVLKVPVTDWTPVAGMNALFVTAAEAIQLAAEYPIVFIKAGQDDQGRTDFAPIAVLGTARGENLYVESGRWRATMLPSQLAMYPFCIARAGEDRYAVCIDQSWPGVVGTGAGERLFGDDGEPSDFMRRMQASLEKLEAQIAQTRVVGRKLAEHDLLRERRFDATLPDGRKLAMDGFLMVDEERLKALPDAVVLDLYRNGLLALIHAHLLSAGHMRRLLQWHVEREQRKPAAAPPAAANDAPPTTH